MQHLHCSVEIDVSSEGTKLCHIQENIAVLNSNIAVHIQQQLHQLSSLNFIPMQILNKAEIL